jgi:hypothetical protein
LRLGDATKSTVNPLSGLAARIALHGGLWLLAFLALFALLRRPFFALGVILVAQLLLMLVSHAKARVLREPLVFADLALYLQALRHPRLYLPYFGEGRALLVAGVVAALVLVGVEVDRPASLSLAGWAGLFAAGVALLLAGTALGRNALSLEPGEDVAAYGLVASLWLYWLEEDKPLPRIEGPFVHRNSGSDPELPVVVVQSESFFDARRLGARVAKDVLPNYDARAAEGESGPLAVPVWGAYTMRTEFAFLSGIAPRALGVHRFNPYRRFARHGAATIASALRARGYRTLCIHPYPASFFGRDRVFPELGFDEFLDVKSFENAERQGPYVADSAVSKAIVKALGPRVFIFAMTMENHGPYHLEGGDELAIYLRHLRNADRMIGEVCGALKEGVFCLYGDHVPGLPRSYAALDYDDSRSDYLIWSNTRRAQRRAERQAHELGVRVLEIASG